MTRVKPWTVGQLVAALEHDMLSCNTALERACARLCTARDIAAIARERKLSPGEVAIAEHNGFGQAVREPWTPRYVT